MDVMKTQKTGTQLDKEGREKCSDGMGQRGRETTREEKEGRRKEEEGRETERGGREEGRK